MTELWVVYRECFMPQPLTSKCHSCGSMRLEPYRAPHSLDAEFRKPSESLRHRVYILYARNPKITAKEASELLAALPKNSESFYRHNQNYLDKILSDLRERSTTV